MAPYTTTAAQLFTDVLPAYLKEAALQFPGAILFDIEGKNGGAWLVDFGARTVTAGALSSGPAIKVVVKAYERDFMALVEGRMSADDGLLTKRLHLAGDAVAIAQLMDVVEHLRSLLR